MIENEAQARTTRAQATQALVGICMVSLGVSVIYWPAGPIVGGLLIWLDARLSR